VGRERCGGRVTDRADAPVDGGEEAVSGQVVDRPVGNADGEQLSAGDTAALTSGDPRDPLLPCPRDGDRTTHPQYLDEVRRLVANCWRRYDTVRAGNSGVSSRRHRWESPQRRTLTLPSAVLKQRCCSQGAGDRDGRGTATTTATAAPPPRTPRSRRT